MSSSGFHGGLDKVGFRRVARSLAKVLEKGQIVGLVGDLGAGKTTFCAEVIRCLSGDEFLGSPTFAIVNSYTCPSFSMYHVDLYRVSAAELCEIGIYDIATEESVLLIEWPEILEGKIPFDVMITIRDTPGSSGRKRDVTIERKQYAFS